VLLSSIVEVRPRRWVGSSVRDSPAAAEGALTLVALCGTAEAMPFPVLAPKEAQQVEKVAEVPSAGSGQPFAGRGTWRRKAGSLRLRRAGFLTGFQPNSEWHPVLGTRFGMHPLQAYRTKLRGFHFEQTVRLVQRTNHLQLRASPFAKYLKHARQSENEIFRNH